jgi:hypothetical protein
VVLDRTGAATAGAAANASALASPSTHADPFKVVIISSFLSSWLRANRPVGEKTQ